MHDYRVILDAKSDRSSRSGKRIGWLLGLTVVASASAYALYTPSTQPEIALTTESTIAAPLQSADSSPEENNSVSIQLSLPNSSATAPTSTPETTNTHKIALAPAKLTASPVIPTSKPEVAPEPEKTEASPKIEAAKPEIKASAEPLEDSVEDSEWHNHTVKNGESLAIILNRMNIGSSEIHKLVHTNKETKQLAKIKPGQNIRAEVSESGKIQKLFYDTSKLSSLEVTRIDDVFTTRKLTRDPDLRTTHASATIDNSLFLSGQAAGLSDSIIMELAAIFGWDIDFALDIRKGDHFTVVYEEQYLDGDKLKDGSIISAEFTNQGRTIQAVRYTDPEGNTGYFSPDGRSMRKAFLRSPVDFTRISSRFNLKRKHPLLNRIRAHKGVDYAASQGTPVRATGDGKVSYRGRKGGYGKTLVIQHGGQYETLYAHLSNYAGKAQKNSRVKQGQIIGYVGQTGLATGPHLHYEFHVNGVHRNPLTVKLPEAAPIAKKFKSDFNSKTKPLLSALETYRTTVVARR